MAEHRVGCPGTHQHLRYGEETVTAGLGNSSIWHNKACCGGTGTILDPRTEALRREPSNDELIISGGDDWPFALDTSLAALVRCAAALGVTVTFAPHQRSFSWKLPDGMVQIYDQYGMTPEEALMTVLVDRWEQVRDA